MPHRGFSEEDISTDGAAAEAPLAVPRNFGAKAHESPTSSRTPPEPWSARATVAQNRSALADLEGTLYTLIASKPASRPYGSGPWRMVNRCALAAICILGFGLVMAVFSCHWRRSRWKTAKRTLDKRLLQPVAREAMRAMEPEIAPLVLVDVHYGGLHALLLRVSNATPLKHPGAAHLWAQPPRTLGCLAIAHIGALLAKNGGADEILRSGGVLVLMEQLEASADRRQHAVLVLGLLSSDGDAAKVMLEHGLPDRLARWVVLDASPDPELAPGLVPAAEVDRWRRAAVGLVLHNLFLWSQPAEHAFLEANGYQALTDLVQCPDLAVEPKVRAMQQAAHLHAILTLLDIVGEHGADQVTRSKSFFGALSDACCCGYMTCLRGGREIYRARPASERPDGGKARLLVAAAPALRGRLQDLCKPRSMAETQVTRHAQALLHDLEAALAN